MLSSRLAAALFLAIAFFGFLDASFVTLERLQGAIPPCTPGGGCESVLTSEYASWWGMPVSVVGAAYYLFVIVMALWYLDRREERALRFIGCVTYLGLAFSAWFVYVQLFILGAVCIYCMFSAAASAALFLVGLFRERARSRPDPLGAVPVGSADDLRNKNEQS